MVEEKYSYHKDEDKVADFIRETVLTNSPELQYRTQGPGSMHSVSGEIHNEVMRSKELGVWKPVNENVTLV